MLKYCLYFRFVVFDIEVLQPLLIPIKVTLVGK